MLWQVIQGATVLGLVHVVYSLTQFHKRAYGSETLRARYLRLPDTGIVVKAFVIMNNSALRSPGATAPALALACLEGTDEGDALAEVTTAALLDNVLIEEAQDPVSRAIATMMADEEYRAFRKRPLPIPLAGGRVVHMLDVVLDSDLLAGNRLSGDSDLYLLVDPSPRGLILQIPSAPLPPPPLPSAAHGAS